jgi:tetratricopeptide (TPR) repeat protein
VRESGGAALVLAEESGDVQGLAQAYSMLRILDNSFGRRESAHEKLSRSLNLAEALPDPGARVAALHNLAFVHWHDGDIEEASRLSAEALALCASQGDRHREAALHNTMADLLHASGSSEEAMDHLKRAVTIYAEIGVEAGAVRPEVWKLTEW